MIIVCEPQCAGFEHAEVNAALLAVISHAFPDEEIHFLAEKDHLRNVSKTLLDHSIENVLCEEIDIPKPGTINLTRLPAEKRLVRKAFDLARHHGCSTILFASITSAGLIAIKKLLKQYTELRCLVIPHGILETVIKRPSVLPWHFVFWFRFALKFGNQDRITYLVLGEPIKKRLAQELPEIKDKIRSITLPMFLQKTGELPMLEPDIIRFGTFGVAHHLKGSDLFFKIANDAVACSTLLNPEFTLIGHVGDRKLMKLRLDNVNIPSPDKPISRKEFDQYAANIDYSVYFYSPASYQLTASGALFDAFSYVKPIIALRNPFFEYYFDMLGDIGYLCDTYEDMRGVVLNILNTRPTERYEQQLKNILIGREEFSLQNLGKQFKCIWVEQTK